MRQEDVIARLGAERPALERLGVALLRLFGSCARNAAIEQSDIDLLVRFSRPASFDRYMDLKLYLEHVLGLPVDLVTEDALRPQLRGTVEKEAIRVG